MCETVRSDLTREVSEGSGGSVPGGSSTYHPLPPILAASNLLTGLRETYAHNETFTENSDTAISIEYPTVRECNMQRFYAADCRSIHRLLITGEVHERYNNRNSTGKVEKIQ